LESSFRLLYPTYEIIIAIENPEDPTERIAKKLTSAYLHVDAKITIASQNYVGLNRKIHNIIMPLELTCYDLIWITDFSVFVLDSNSILFELMNPMIDDLPPPHHIGLVH
jgi:cellulose synthase/poly-beta-1,6-N-acetylglucosamine synthase-like glycosyltransferase